MMADVEERASRVRLLLMDVDGVLTDGHLLLVPGPKGQMVETKAFDSQDGIALQWLGWHGIDSGVISGRISPAVEARARQVGMRFVFQGHLEKVPILERIAASSGLEPSAMAYMGDDLTDVVVMRRVGLALAPANARKEVRQMAHYVTAARGGAGAVREAAELLLKAHGRWADILRKYEVA
jgi:3-deoxy-D-manno-octulosonate 8-phosphate phosphatase (KDO 8-P phosphatase)